MKIIKLFDPIYRANLRVMINCSFDDCRKHTLKEFNTELQENNSLANGKAFALSDGSYLVWVEKFNWSIDCQGVLVHELLHIAFYVIGDRGIKIDSDEDEALAYYFEYLFNSVWNKLKPKKKSKRKTA